MIRVRQKLIIGTAEIVIENTDIDLGLLANGDMMATLCCANTQIELKLNEHAEVWLWSWKNNEWIFVQSTKALKKEYNFKKDLESVTLAID